jgi:UDP-N-acetyl-D-glucosamine dehydrogenase
MTIIEGDHGAVTPPRDEIVRLLSVDAVVEDAIEEAKIEDAIIEEAVAALPPFAVDIAIVGMGYVGLPTALSFHAAGRRVLGIDVSAERLAAIRDEQADLLDSDRVRLHDALTDGRFTLSSDPETLTSAECIIICVPTPVDAYLVPDLAILRKACASVVAHAVPGHLIVLTSTTYVGSTYDLLVAPLLERGLIPGTDVFIAFSPERIDPGNDQHAHEDVARVVGGVTPRCSEKAEKALASYARLVHRVSSPEAAEMTKLLENTFRAVNIAMINEFADASRTLRLDVMEVIRAASTKPYGFMPFTPGAGVGGHCIPCDPHYLLWQLRKEHTSTPLIDQAMKSIAARPHRVVERAREVLSQAGKPLNGSTVLLVGVSYKPDVEDVRESPALEIAEDLLAAGAELTYFDPYIPALRLHSGRILKSVVQPDVAAADLVVTHTLHSNLEPSFFTGAQLVLDATYRLSLGPNGETL